MSSANVLKRIVDHCILLDRLELLTQRIFEATTKQDYDTVYSESLNKERLIKNLEHAQLKVEAEVKSTPSSDEIKEFLKLWANDFQEVSQRIRDKDDQTAQHLNKAKEQTTQEIATVFTYKEQIKGYNLNNLKK